MVSAAEPAKEGLAGVLPEQVFASLSQGDTELSEVQEESEFSPPQVAIQTATAPLLNPVVSPVLPVQETPTQTTQPEVEHHTKLHFTETFV